MDRAIQNATARRDEALAEMKGLQERVAALRAEVDEIDAFIASWHRFAGTQIDAEPAKRFHFSSEAIADRKRQRATGNPKKETVADSAREIIRERNDAVPRAELYQALAARGIIIEGADPEKTLSTMLWRTRDRIVRLKSGGYWLADEPNEALGYEPMRDSPVAEAYAEAQEQAEDAAYASWRESQAG